MCESKSEIIRPAGMPCEEQRSQAAVLQLFLQRCERPYRQTVILRQSRDKAVAAVCAEPDRIAGKQIPVVDQITQVSSGMVKNQETIKFVIVQ